MAATDSQLKIDLEERFNPFIEPYLTDPYLFFAEARTAGVLQSKAGLLGRHSLPRHS